MGSIRETTEFGYCVKETGGWMWKVALWALSLALCCLCAPTFLPKCFQIMAFSLLLSWRHVKKIILKVFLFVCLFFHHSGEESLFWDYSFHLPEKYDLPSPDEQGGNNNSMWILAGTWSELGWLKSRCLHAFALESHHNQIFLFLFTNVS